MFTTLVTGSSLLLGGLDILEEVLVIEKNPERKTNRLSAGSGGESGRWGRGEEEREDKKGGGGATFPAGADCPHPVYNSGSHGH